MVPDGISKHDITSETVVEDFSFPADTFVATSTHASLKKKGPFLSRTFVRALGVLGTMGGFLLIVIDLIYYFDPTQDWKPFVVYYNLGRVSPWRTMVAETLLLPACLLCVCGGLQVYLAFGPAPRIAQAVVGGSFSCFICSFCMLTMLQAVASTFARIAIDSGLDEVLVYEEPFQADRWFRNALLVCQLVFAIAYLPSVYLGKTHYPRWMCATIPLMLIIFRLPLMRLVQWLESSLLTQLIAAPIHKYAIFLFYLTSTITLWDAKIACGVCLPLEEIDVSEALMK